MWDTLKQTLSEPFVVVMSCVLVVLAALLIIAVLGQLVAGLVP